MILLFDTSTPTGILTVGDANSAIAHSSWKAEHSHSQKLPIHIDSAVQKLPNALKDISHIAVGIGPGSFTGLRVALATAKGLGVALNVSLIAIPSLTLFAAACQARTDFVVCCSDAFRGEIYLGVYKLTDSQPILMNDISSVTPQSAVQAISQLNGTVTIVGTGYERYADIFPSSMIGMTSQFDETAATAVLKLTSQYATSHKLSDPIALLPYYVRDAEAVEKQLR